MRREQRAALLHKLAVVRSRHSTLVREPLRRIGFRFRHAQRIAHALEGAAAAGASLHPQHRETKVRSLAGCLRLPLLRSSPRQPAGSPIELAASPQRSDPALSIALAVDSTVRVTPPSVVDQVAVARRQRVTRRRGLFPAPFGLSRCPRTVLSAAYKRSYVAVRNRADSLVSGSRRPRPPLICSRAFSIETATAPVRGGSIPS